MVVYPQITQILLNNLCNLWMVLSGVPEHCEVVADRSGNDEEVPDEMVISDPVGGEERETSRVSEPTGEYQ